MKMSFALRDVALRNSRTAVEQTSDEALIESIARGDQRAMATLFARHNVRIFRFVMHRVGDATSAEDIVNDVFHEVWRHAGSFKGDSRVSTWLLAIARFKAISAARHHVEDQLDDDYAKTLEDPAQDAEAALNELDRSAILQKCLRQLPPEQHEVLDLVYYHGKSVAEVATITAASPGTVKSRMFYARKHLADLCRAEDIRSA